MIYHDISMSITTIRITSEIKNEIANRANFPGETMESILKRMLEHYDMDLYLNKEEVKTVQKGLDDIKAGQTVSSSELRKKLGLK